MGDGKGDSVSVDIMSKYLTWQLIVGILLLAHGGYLFVQNWLLAIGKLGPGSPLPFVSGVLVSLGLLLVAPGHHWALYVWPLVLDYGGVPIVLVQTWIAWRDGAFD